MASRSTRSLVRLLVVLAVGAGIVWFILVGYDVASAWESGRRAEAALIEVAEEREGANVAMADVLDRQFLATGLEAVYPICPYVTEVQIRAALLPEWVYEGGDGPVTESPSGTTLLLLYGDGTVTAASGISPEIELCTGVDAAEVIDAETPWSVTRLESSGSDDTWVLRPVQ